MIGVPYDIGSEANAVSFVYSLFTLRYNSCNELLIFLYSLHESGRSQVDADATAAPKLSSNESYVDLNTMTAAQIHNKCRGFSDWPGIYSTFLLGSNATVPQKVKIITTTTLDLPIVEGYLKDSNSESSPIEAAGEGGRKKVTWVKSLGLLVVECAGGNLP